MHQSDHNWPLILCPKAPMNLSSKDNKRVQAYMYKHGSLLHLCTQGKIMAILCKCDITPYCLQKRETEAHYGQKSIVDKERQISHDNHPNSQEIHHKMHSCGEWEPSPILLLLFIHLRDDSFFLESKWRTPSTGDILQALSNYWPRKWSSLQ